MLIDYSEKKMLTRIGAHYKIEFTEMPLPQDEDVENLVAQRLFGQLEARLRDRDRLQIERMQRFIPLAKEMAEEEEGLSLLAMLLDDTYHEWMHHPPDLPPVGTKSKPKQSSGRRSGRSGGKRRSNRGGKRRKS